MKKNEDRQPGTPGTPDAPTTIERLIQLAGHGEDAEPERRNRVFHKVQAEWQEEFVRTRQRRQLGLRIAAGFILMVGLLGWWRPWVPAGDTDLSPTLQIVRWAGSVELKAPAEGSPWFQLDASRSQLESGLVIRTGTESRVALDSGGGSSIRLDVDSSLEWLGGSEFRLHKGAVYVDSRLAESWVIQTAYGSARDIGTQFEVRVLEDAMRVRVREGAVVLQSGKNSGEVGPGDQLILDASGNLHRQAIALYGAPWSWVMEMATPFELEGQTLKTFLEWVHRETGWKIQYGADLAREDYDEIVLHGALQGIEPNEAAAVVLATCDLVPEVESGVMRIEGAP